jgi:hypothetical protein
MAGLRRDWVGAGLYRPRPRDSGTIVSDARRNPLFAHISSNASLNATEGAAHGGFSLVRRRRHYGECRRPRTAVAEDELQAIACLRGCRCRLRWAAIRRRLGGEQTWMGRGDPVAVRCRRHTGCARPHRLRAGWGVASTSYPTLGKRHGGRWCLAAEFTCALSGA